MWFESLAGDIGDRLHPEGNENTVDDFSFDDLLEQLGINDLPVIDPETEREISEILNEEEPDLEDLLNVLTCSDCPESECTGHCFSCPYGAQ